MVVRSQILVPRILIPILLVSKSLNLYAVQFHCSLIDWIIKAKFVLGIILSLQGLQSLLPPVLEPIQLLRSFIVRSIINVSVQRPAHKIATMKQGSSLASVGRCNSIAGWTRVGNCQ